MGKSGFLRRVAILLAFAWFYATVVISNEEWFPDPQHREWLHWLLYGAITWGVVTMLADRLGCGLNPTGDEDDD